MGITGIHAIPMMITCMLQGTLCDTGIPCTFYGENIDGPDGRKENGAVLPNPKLKLICVRLGNDNYNIEYSLFDFSWLNFLEKIHFALPRQFD